MQNISLQTKFHLEYLAIFFLLLIISIAPNFGSATILDDPFHHGEYFASAVNFFSSDSSKVTPLTIHGALDFIPATLAKFHWGQDRYFFPTWVIYRLLDLFSAVALVAIAYETTRNKAPQTILLMALAVVAPRLVGYRDVFLLASIYVFVLLQTRSFKCSTRNSFQIFFGILVALGLFWSFDRGIAGALSLGLATLRLTYKRQGYAISLVSFFMVILLLSYSWKEFSLSNYFENLTVLAETSSQWSYGWTRQTFLLTGYALLLAVAAFIILFLVVIENIKSVIFWAIPLALAAVSVFMIKIGTNRADIQHILMSLWAPILVYNVFWGVLAKPPTYLKLLSLTFVLASLKFTIYYANPVFLVIGGMILFVSCSKLQFRSKIANYLLPLIIIIPVAISAAKDIKEISNKNYHWILKIINPPANVDVSTEGVRWVSEQLIKHNAKCVFDLSNNGIINGLTNLPSCTRFTYPVYAGSKHETELIDGVKFAAPSAIIYSTTYWSYSIDGRKMNDRFPLLDAYLIKSYPNEECSLGYCVRYM